MAFQPHAFGKYWLVDRIATGGMAEVFKAKTYGHGGFEHLLVIKRILDHLGQDPDFVDMFIDEAKVSVALQHANIVRLYDFGRIGDDWFMAMELLDGKDVRNILRKLSRSRRYLPVEHALLIAVEACKGLDYAHRKTDLHGRPYGIVHRDMSPSNLLVSYEGEVKVADFGIAKTMFSSETTRGGLKGKYEYMSPEQASGRRLDHRTDLFSLGIVLHEMLTGRRLFKSADDPTTLERVKAADVPAPSEVNPRVPEALDRIVMKALARDPEARWQSAADLGAALQEHLFPQTLDQVRADLARLMHEVFADEIVEERQRLAHGSDIAANRRAQVGDHPDGWDGQTGSSLSSRSLDAAQRFGPLLLGLAALAVLPLLALSAGALVWVLRSPPAVEAPTPTSGAIDVVVLPSARVTVDGTLIGEGDVLAATDLEPGSHVVRLEREGYETVLETVRVTAGQRVSLTRTLTPLAEAEATPAPEPAPEPTATVPTPQPDPAPSAAPEPVAATGTLTVTIVGGGWARVWVDDAPIEGTAPLSVELPAGAHQVRVENAGLGISHSQQVEIVAGERETLRVRPL